MVRRFRPDPVPEQLVSSILRAGLRAPSAGFSQGVDLVVVTAQDERDAFWQAVDPRGRKKRDPGEPPVLVIVCADPSAYAERYSLPDKEGLGLDRLENWPVPYWHVDAGMSIMAMLLKAVDLGLGGWFFGVFVGEDGLRARLSIPEEVEIVGALAIGYALEGDRPSGSPTRVPRRADTDAIHLSRWGNRGQ